MAEKFVSDEELDLRTDVEKERDERRKAVCAHYASIRSKAPNAVVSRIINKVSKDCGVSTTFVRTAVIEAGLYRPASRS